MNTCFFLLIPILLGVLTNITSIGENEFEHVREPEDPRLTALEDFLLAQYDTDIKLVRESPDASINRTYWLLSDNLLAYHALKHRHPEVADRIYERMIEYGFFQDGLHEVLFGEEIILPPYTHEIIVVENTSDYTIKTEVREGSEDDKIMDDWAEYADILLYASLNFYNKGQLDKSLYYFTKAKNMWNEAGLYDKPTQQDGYYTTHKLALLLYVSHVLNQTLPFRETLEERIWTMQRSDGGVRSHYLGNMICNREANSETSSII